MSAEEMVENALKENPDVRLILQIAARARELEAREPARELGASTEVTAIPYNPQLPVSWCVLDDK